MWKKRKKQHVKTLDLSFETFPFGEADEAADTSIVNASLLTSSVRGKIWKKRKNREKLQNFSRGKKI